MHNFSVIFGKEKSIQVLLQSRNIVEPIFTKLSFDSLRSLYLKAPKNNMKFIKRSCNDEYNILLITNESLRENDLTIIFKRITSEYKKNKDYYNFDQYLGSYIIFIHDIINNKLAIINDYFGSIPIYYFCSINYSIFGTDIGFIASLLDNFKFNNLAVFQFSCSEYCLSDRTLIADIKILNPSSIFTINLDGRITYKYEFFNTHIEKRIVNSFQAFKVLDDLFINYFKRTIPPGSNITLTLTGGLDSRIIAGYLDSFKCNVNTFYVGEHGYWDQRFGQSIAEILAMPYKVFTPNSYRQNDFVRLYLNYSSPELSFRHTHFLENVEEIINSYDKIIGGVFGGEIFGQKTIIRDFLNASMYLRYIKSFFFRKSGVFEKRNEFFLYNTQNDFLQTVEELTDSIYDKSNSIDLCASYDGFILNRYLRRLILNGSPVLFTGKSSYLTPFLDKEITTFAHSLKTDMRIEQRFYREFLEWKFPHLAKVPWQYTGFPISEYGICKYDPDQRGDFRNYNTIFKNNNNLFRDLVNGARNDYGLFNIINRDLIIRLINMSLKDKSFKDSVMLSISLTLCLLVARIEKYKDVIK